MKNKEISHKKLNIKKSGIRLGIVLFWLFVWQGVAWAIDNSILLEGPIGVIKRLVSDLTTLEYYQTVGSSMLRILGGTVVGVILALMLCVMAWKQKILEDFLGLPIQFLKAAPIACFVVLLLIWAGSHNLSFYVAVIVALPPVYMSVLEGLKQLPKGQLEVARVYHMPFGSRMRFIYLPGVKPYFISALSLAIGTAFKAGIAAEIIGTPDVSMGEKIYMSKIYLDTQGVLSWMVTVILVAYLCEKLIIRLVIFYFEKRPSVYRMKKNSGKALECSQSRDIILKDCTISYGQEVILQNANAVFEAKKVYAIEGMSGKGKTTFFNTLIGLKKPSGGQILGRDQSFSVVFQENRLFEGFTVLENIFATGQCTLDYKMAEAAALELLSRESLLKPIKEYSGGMKRRAELLRAMLANGNIVILDEPFNGLDYETKLKTIAFIKKYQNERTILFTTHNQEDVDKMQGEKRDLWKKEDFTVQEELQIKSR